MLNPAKAATAAPVIQYFLVMLNLLALANLYAQG